MLTFTHNSVGHEKFFYFKAHFQSNTSAGFLKNEKRAEKEYNQRNTSTHSWVGVLLISSSTCMVRTA